MCFYTTKTKIIGQVFPNTDVFPALLWIPLHGAEGEADLIHSHLQAAAHGKEVVSLTPEVMGEPLSSFTIPRGSGCTCGEISVTDTITPQSTHTFATEGS